MAKLLAALAGVSAWLSLATLMVTDELTLARSAALPPWSWLAGFVIAAVALAVFTRLSLSRAWPLAISLLIWLPFLPFRIPIAFLVWSGPIEWAVWIAVVAGLLWPAPDLPASRAPWIAGAIVVIAATAGFVAMEGTIPGGDEPHYLIITQSLLHDHDLLIENNHKQGDYKAYFKTQDLSKPDYIVRGQDGEIYPIHPPGVAALVIPGFAIAGYQGAVATIILCTATASGLIWLVAWWFTADAGAAWFAWAAIFLTTPFFFHEFTIYPDGAGALLASFALLLLVRMELGLTTGPAWLAGTGVALALLPFFHTRFAVLAASAGLVIVLRIVGRVDWRLALAYFLTIPVLSAAAWFGYFWIIWGTPNPAVPYGSVTETTLANITRGAPGLLFDQQFGLIAQAPVYAFAILGLISLARTRTRFAIEWLVLTVPYFLATSAYHMWWGGVSAPARFITALMPMASIPLAWWWAAPRTLAPRTLAPRTLALAMLLLSIVLVIPHALVQNGSLVFNDRDGFDLLLQWASTHVDLPMAFPGLHRGPEGFMMMETAVWGVAGITLLIVASVLSRSRLQSAGAVWTTTVWTCATLAMIAATTVWTMNGSAGVTAGRSQLAALTDWHRDWQTTALRIRPLRSLTAAEFERQIEIGSTDRPSTSTSDQDQPTLLRVSFLPAGDYDIVTEGRSALGGELFLWTGKTDLPTERWRLEGKQPGFTGLVASFPVPVYSATFRGDPEARASIRKLTLRMRSLGTSEFGPGRFALRAVRYGATRAFFMDDHAYMEANGFWTRGESATMVVADTAADQPPPTVWLQSGPIGTSVQLRVGSWTSEVALNAQERKSVALPANDQHRWPIEITTGAAFRPSEVIPGNGDTRSLGVWVELRGNGS